MSRKIAYFINQYPMISHTFIRREIQALEGQGLDVLRVSLRGWDGKLVNDVDHEERRKTRYVLKDGAPGLLLAALQVSCLRPLRFLSAMALAIRVGWRSERPLVYHFAYLMEACRLLLWLREFGAGHVHAHFGTNSAEVVMLCEKLGGPPYSFTVHGPKEFDKPELLHLGEKIRRSAFVVAITSFTKSQLFRWVDRSHWKKINVVRCGLDAEFFQGAPQLPAQAPRLVCLGRLVEQKGQLLLIDAVHRLAQAGSKVEIVLVGDGEMRGEIERHIDQLGLWSHIRLTGSLGTDDLRREILQSRALVLPSFAEGLPVVIMETMALRRPVIATYIAGIPELITHGQNGWLIPAGSVDDLAQAIDDVLRRSVEELRDMGESAYQAVRARHFADTEAKKLAVLFSGGELEQ